MKCQILFSRKNKTNTISLSSAEFAQSMVCVRGFISYYSFSRHIRGDNCRIVTAEVAILGCNMCSPKFSICCKNSNNRLGVY